MNIVWLLAWKVKGCVSCINEFSSYLTLSPWIMNWMKFCPGNMIITSKFDETGTVCSIWTKCDSSLIFSLFVMSFASGADHQASSAIVSKQSLMSKIYTQSHFVHMLQTLPVSSNSEVLIMFPEQFDIYSLVIEVYL